MAINKKQTNKDEISPMYKHLALGPELRSEEPKGAYPQGRIKQVFAVFGAEMNSLMRMNAWFLLFAIPLFFVVYWCSNYFANVAISGFNFVGNVGMAYPGGSDTMVSGQIAIYNAYQLVLYLCVPAIFIMGIGFAGSFNVLKGYMWGEKVEKITKTFFRGIKRNWWKYLLVALVDALLVLALGSAFIYFLKLCAMSEANAGHWVMIIVVCIAEFVLFYFNMLILPFISELDVPFFKLIKDTFILGIKFAPMGMPLFAVCLVPIALFFTRSSLVLILFIVLFAMFGINLYGLILTGFSQYILDGVVTPLYKMSQNPKTLDKTVKTAKKPQDFKKAQNKSTKK